MGVPLKAKRHRWEDSRSDGTGRRSDPTNETIRAGAKDAEYKSGSDTKEGERLLLGTWVQMTFPTGGVKMEYSEEEIFAVLNESEQARKHRQKLAKVTETVYFQARVQLATWTRTHGYDRDDSWMHGALPLSPEEFTASLWSNLQELKDAISMSGKARPWQKTIEFLDGLKGDLSDEELAAIKRYVESRSREAAQVTVAPVSTAQHCIPRSLNPEIPSDVHVNMEKKDEGRMNPELTEFESSSAGTDLETPGQQCPPIEGIW